MRLVAGFRPDTLGELAGLKGRGRREGRGMGKGRWEERGEGKRREMEGGRRKGEDPPMFEMH